MRLINRAPIPAMFIVAFVWGASFPATQRLLDDLSTRQALCVRFSLAWAIMAAFELFGGRSRRASTGEHRHQAPAGAISWRAAASAWGPPILSGALLLIVFWMEIEALARTTVSSVAVLLAATTVVTAIVERMTGAAQLSTMTVIAGIAVIVGTLLMSAGPRGFGMGEALALGSNLPRALQMAISRRIVLPEGRTQEELGVPQSPGGAEFPADHAQPFDWRHRARALGRSGPERTPIALARFQFFVVGLGAAVLTLAEGDVPRLPSSLGGWGALLFLTVACTIGAFVTISAALVHVSASIATLVLSTEPVWGVVLGVAVLGERLGLAGAIGALLIVSSAVLGSVGQPSH